MHPDALIKILIGPASLWKSLYKFIQGVSVVTTLAYIEVLFGWLILWHDPITPLFPFWEYHTTNWLRTFVGSTDHVIGWRGNRYEPSTCRLITPNLVIICACALQRPATELNKIYSQGFSSGTGRSICTNVAFLQPNGTKFLKLKVMTEIAVHWSIVREKHCWLAEKVRLIRTCFLLPKVRLSYQPYFFCQPTVFFSHDKSMNSNFSHDFSTIIYITTHFVMLEQVA
jgi:hypothetical protein